MAKRTTKKPARKQLSLNDLDLGIGLLEELAKKKLDAKLRLNDNFVAFVRTKGTGLFVAGGDVEAGFFGHRNFFAAYTAYSSGEVSEVKSIINNLAEYTRRRFSDDDFHSTVILEFMTEYLKSVMEDKDIPQGLAAEMIMIDRVAKLTRIYTTGDHERDGLNDVDEDYFIIGCYRDQLRKRLLDELTDVVDPAKKMNDQKAAEVITHLKEKFKLPYVAFRMVRLAS